MLINQQEESTNSFHMERTTVFFVQLLLERITILIHIYFLCLDSEQKILDPGRSSGSSRIRIHNTDSDAL